MSWQWRLTEQAPWNYRLPPPSTANFPPETPQFYKELADKHAWPVLTAPYQATGKLDWEHSPPVRHRQAASPTGTLVNPHKQG